MITAIQEKQENKFQSTLEYLGEYRGVKGAVIFDNEGLVVGQMNNSNVEAEIFSPLALLMLEQMNQGLNRLGETPVLSLTVKTKGSWITLNCIDNLILVVNADSDTDELLKVRIGQAVDMIKSTLVKNYPLLAR